MKHRVKIPYLIGLTHTDCPDAWQIEDVALALGLSEESTKPPMMSVNATESASVKESLIALVEEFARYYQYFTE
jgi:hypothetical protein